MDMKTVEVIFTYARMNPPTDGHRRVVERIQQIAAERGGVARVYLSETHDQDRNPLDKDTKLSLARKAFPNVDIRSAKTVFEAGQDVAIGGDVDAVMIVGEDRLHGFTKALTAYVGTDDLPLKSIEILAIDRTDDDVSATKARIAAQSNDWVAFQAMSPTSDESVTRELFHAVRNGMEARNVTI